MSRLVFTPHIIGVGLLIKECDAARSKQVNRSDKKVLTRINYELLPCFERKSWLVFLIHLRGKIVLIGITNRQVLQLYQVLLYIDYYSNLPMVFPSIFQQ